MSWECMLVPWEFTSHAEIRMFQLPTRNVLERWESRGSATIHWWGKTCGPYDFSFLWNKDRGKLWLWLRAHHIWWRVWVEYMIVSDWLTCGWDYGEYGQKGVGWRSGLTLVDFLVDFRLTLFEEGLELTLMKSFSRLHFIEYPTHTPPVWTSGFAFCEKTMTGVGWVEVGRNWFVEGRCWGGRGTYGDEAVDEVVE